MGHLDPFAPTKMTVWGLRGPPIRPFLAIFNLSINYLLLGNFELPKIHKNSKLFGTLSQKVGIEMFVILSILYRIVLNFVTKN